MQAKIHNHFILNRRSVMSGLEFTPISAFLCILSLVVPFTTPLPHPTAFILLASPLYLNIHSIPLGISLICLAVWPGADISVRVTLVLSALYIIGASSRR